MGGRLTGDSQIRVRGGCVCLDDKGILITGASGMGKSALALDLMAMGARLVSDDWTILRVAEGGLLADAPEALRGRIEARGIGILAASPAGPTALQLVVDLGTEPDDRLPPRRAVEMAGLSLPLVKAVYHAHLGAALRQLLIGGRLA